MYGMRTSPLLFSSFLVDFCFIFSVCLLSFTWPCRWPIWDSHNLRGLHEWRVLLFLCLGLLSQCCLFCLTMFWPRPTFDAADGGIGIASTGWCALLFCRGYKLDRIYDQIIHKRQPSELMTSSQSSKVDSHQLINTIKWTRFLTGAEIFWVSTTSKFPGFENENFSILLTFGTILMNLIQEKSFTTMVFPFSKWRVGWRVFSPYGWCN